jgi:hypothetical protein
MVLTVMGVINIVIACLALVCSLGGIGANMFVRSMAKSPAFGGAKNPAADQFAYMDREAPGWMTYEVSHDCIAILISFLLIFAGVGLLMRKNLGRWLSLFCAVAIIALRLSFAIYKATVTIPVLERWQRMQIGGGAAASGFRLGGYFGIGAVLALWLAFAAAICITMFTPAAVEACAPPSKRKRRRDEEDEFDDDLDEDRPLRHGLDDGDDEPPRRSRRLPDDDEPDTAFRSRD